MKKIVLIFFLLSACSTQKENISSTYGSKITDELSFDEFKKRLVIYANNSPYPNIDD
tara:strand:+ start:502 stop:672 length:171 start_codon:yes stop_codon:yes gene_type:complete